MNNPLIYTDPTGEKFLEWLKKTTQIVLIIIVDAVTIVYVGACIVGGYIGGVALGGIITLNPIGGIIGGGLGIVAGATFGATTGIWANKKIDNWINSW